MPSLKICRNSIYSLLVCHHRFNLLYFLRAFERTGPLVSMIYHIAMDIRALVGVLGLVCVGFAQAFWLLSNTTNKEAYNFQSDLPFSSVKMSYVNSFSYMLVCSFTLLIIASVSECLLTFNIVR